MGPTNVALVKLYQADQKLRDATARLDAVTRDVRLQERRIADLSQKQAQLIQRHREQQATAANLELEIRSRDEHLEKLRTQQQDARTNKEYQAFLIEINTHKVDRSKAEEQTLKVMELVETLARELAALTASLDTEREKLAAMQAQVGDKAATLEAEIAGLRPTRDSAAAAVPEKALVEFERLASHLDGEALAPLFKPDRKREEYICGGCYMELMVDTYNKLHSRDVQVTCPSCRRMLFIPDDLPVSEAVKSKGKSTRTRKAAATAAVVVDLDSPQGRWRDLVLSAQRESHGAANDAHTAPVECRVTINGDLIGTFMGRDSDHLLRVIRVQFEEKNIAADVTVEAVGASAAATAPADPAPAANP